MTRRSPTERVRIARFEEGVVTPWRNGLGTTRVLRSPGEGSDEWWVSVADLVAPGPFSVFPGVDRVFTPVGAAVELALDGDVHDVLDRQPVPFSGEAAVTLALPEGPARALNVFAARARCRLDVRISGVRGRVEPCSALVLLEGTARVSDGRHLGFLDLAEGPAEVDGVVLIIGIAAPDPGPQDGRAP